MSIKNERAAGWVTHPGVILKKEFLEPLNITPHRLAKDLHVAPPTVNQIVLQRSSISPDMAARLARYFGTTEQFWLNLQNAYTVYMFKKEHSKELAAIHPLRVAAGSR
jgi:addiction module HigA family antidote